MAAPPEQMSVLATRRGELTLAALHIRLTYVQGDAFRARDQRET
jgi:hypothetical protein